MWCCRRGSWFATPQVPRLGACRPAGGVAGSILTSVLASSVCAGHGSRSKISQVPERPPTQIPSAVSKTSRTLHVRSSLSWDDILPAWLRISRSFSVKKSFSFRSQSPMYMGFLWRACSSAMVVRRVSTDLGDFGRANERVVRVRTRQQVPAPVYIVRQVISTRTGISSFVGIASSDGGSILKSVILAGIVPEIFASLPCVTF